MNGIDKRGARVKEIGGNKHFMFILIVVSKYHFPLKGTRALWKNSRF